MRGLVVWFLALTFLLAVQATAQVTTPEVPNEEELNLYVNALSIVAPVMQDFQGGGARAMAMGGAFIAISDDGTAVSWNPAGLFQRENPFEQPVMSLSWRSFGNTSEFQNHGFGTSQLFKADDNFADIDFVSLLAPLQIKGHTFVLSGAYSRLGEEAENTAVSIRDSTYYWRPGEDRTGKKTDSLEGILRPWNYDYNYYHHTAINTINVGFGTRLYDRVSFGLAINVYGGKGVGTGRQVIEEDSLVVRADGNQRGNLQFLRGITDSTHYSGVYFTAGFQYVVDKFRSGLVIRTPHTLKEDIDITTYDTLVENSIPTPGNGIFSDNHVFEIDMPLVIQLGAAYQATESLLLACDLEFRNSSSDKINRRDSLRLVPGGKDTEFFTEIDPQWNNVFAIRTGGEYLYNTNWEFVPTVALRGGVAWSQVPQGNIESARLVSENHVEYETTTASKTRLTVGAGARWAQIRLDFAYYHESLELTNKTFQDYIGASNVSTTKNNNFTMTFTGFF